ncbi:aspartate--tRNA ligase [Candidatus Pacearchaeota archaeon CG10_big_fil_rev_8_21_14_0_10_32_14]|nr:MAG: aspartate--tRNA ligase [Candidatus Pacearchaeota archaeon CG10_big_fil_rev_8_21_14_0_10_32_14]
MLRTHTCGELTKKNVGEKVRLCGWVDTIREHGRLNFIDIRDRYGKTQIVLIGKHELKNEYVVCVHGTVNNRKTGTENKELSTGDVEVFADKIDIISKSKIPEIKVNENEATGDDIRMKYRFLDLRRPDMQRNIAFKAKVSQIARDFFIKNNFIEIETPILVKPTPEGARDYIVPSRVNPGTFYALPQSPQLYKQILMIAGFDRYFQFARCLRDEDLRADRQPEHTQMDLEMSFVESEDIMSFVEELYKYIFKEALGITLKDFARLTYKESMERYGTDKPDLRKNKDNPKEFAFCWVYDFPLFSYDKETKTWTPEHHMFTSPKKEHIQFLEKDPGKINGDLFDVVLNGTELGSGSIRINDPELQELVMKFIGMKKEEAHKKFGFLLDAYEYGGPVHGGMGLGFDRLVALMLGYNDIREVMAFPKNKSAQNPMDGSPSEVDDKQLKETHIILNLPKKKEKVTDGKEKVEDKKDKKIVKKK